MINNFIKKSDRYPHNLRYQTVLAICNYKTKHRSNHVFSLVSSFKIGGFFQKSDLMLALILIKIS